MVEKLGKAFSRDDPESIWGRGQISGEDIRDFPTHLSVARVCVDAEVADSLKALGKDVLDHSSYEA